MADVEVTYENTLIKSLSASGQLVCHTAGKFCDDDITIDYTAPGGGGGNGPQVIASGTFVGAGRSISLPIGAVCPLKNFFVMFWSQDTELPYTTGYKIVNALSFNFGELTEFEYYDHYGLYDRYVCSKYQYTVDNSGVITPVSYNAMLDPVRYIRNDTMGQYLNSEATAPAIRKFSDHIEYFFDSHNSNYSFQTTMTYNYKLFYYGNNLSGESISV